MNDAIFTGRLVRLEPADPEILGELFAKWAGDSEYLRLMDSDPMRRRTPKQVREWLEKNVGKFTMWTIRRLEDNRPIGDVDLSDYDWTARHAWVGIAIGEREMWGKGYGSDAMRIVIHYAFRELNLNRINLTVFEYNPRAIRSYQKLGFKEEGRERQWLNRDGRRWDMLYMGLLRREWEAIEETG